MTCSCNKGRQANTADRKAQEARQAEARQRSTSQTSPPPAGARTVPVMQGIQQSFSMQAGDKTARFGSALERDAAVARTGGKAV